MILGIMQLHRFWYYSMWSRPLFSSQSSTLY